jgi:hypothetical protein
MWVRLPSASLKETDMPRQVKGKVRTISQLYHQLVGRTFAWTLAHDEGMEVKVIVTDAAVHWGEERALIQPICGSGSRWVGVGRLREVDDDWGMDLDRRVRVRDARTAFEQRQNDLADRVAAATARLAPDVQRITGNPGSVPDAEGDVVHGGADQNAPAQADLRGDNGAPIDQWLRGERASGAGD